ncbi:hypothetical protein D3C87_1860000 [compost metagenome]
MSAVQESFEVILSCSGQEVMNFVSERAAKVELYRDSSGGGVHVYFEIHGAQAEAVVTFEPEIKCHWWLLRTA